MATSFTEFCCRAGGSNLNSGTRNGSSTEPGTSADFTFTSGTWTGGSTNTFLIIGGASDTGVAVGDFASIYADGATVTTWIARVTAVTATLITLQTTGAGTKPGNLTASASCKIGGAWLGPNTTDQAFPFALATLGALNTVTTLYPTRVNLKNDQTYNVTALTTCTVNVSQLNIQGYTTAYGDGGRATIDGGTSGASYRLLDFTSSGQSVQLFDLIFGNNGSTGSAALVGFAGRQIAQNCVFHDSAGPGITTPSAGPTEPSLFECEFYLCNKNNTAAIGAITIVSGINLVRCVIHDNAGTNTRGLYALTASSNIFCKDCIFDTNGSSGFESVTGGQFILTGCEFYNNVGSGIYINGAINETVFIENCNFILNGSGASTNWGIRLTTGQVKNGIIRNCGFGSGAAGNGSTQTNDIDRANIGALIETGTVTYASGVTPWVDPANGDFRINLAAAEGTGRGTFVETQASYAGTVGYPDIGAAQHSILAGKSLIIQRGTPF